MTYCMMYFLHDQFTAAQRRGTSQLRQNVRLRIFIVLSELKGGSKSNILEKQMVHKIKISPEGLKGRPLKCRF